MEQKTNRKDTLRGIISTDMLHSGKVREAYYSAYCYLRDLEEAGRDLENERIERDAREALNHLQHIYDELEDKYQWD